MTTNSQQLTNELLAILKEIELLTKNHNKTITNYNKKVWGLWRKLDKLREAEIEKQIQSLYVTDTYELNDED